MRRQIPEIDRDFRHPVFLDLRAELEGLSLGKEVHVEAESQCDQDDPDESNVGSYFFNPNQQYPEKSNKSLTRRLGALSTGVALAAPVYAYSIYRKYTS